MDSTKQNFDRFETSDGQESSKFLSRNELMEAAFTPFWVHLRLIFFLLFWIVWFAMLITSLVIIVKTPFCEVFTQPMLNQTNDYLVTTAGSLSDYTKNLFE